MKRSLTVTSALLGLLIVLVACKPSGSLSTSRSPLVTQPVSPFASPMLPTPNPTAAALCARYPTPPYPINLTPCPYYLTPPAQPLDLFTPEPLLTPVLPTLITGAPVATATGGAFKPLYVSQSYKEGNICDLYISPDGQKAAFTICNSEGYTMVLIMDIKEGTGVRVSISDVSGVKPYTKATWFRGWFPDSKHVLLMSDWLEILNVETGERRRITSENETVTDAAVSPDGQKIVCTRIQGDMLKFIDTTGDLLKIIRSPSPKPGDRPENLTWSPNGKWIAYTWDQGTSYYPGPLWVIETSTGQMKQLSPSGVYDLSPRWSPDSATLLVVRRENIKDSKADFDPTQWVSNLWTVNVGGNVWSQLTHLKGKSAWSPNWTPDGSAIVFMSSLGSQPGAWSINLDGTGLQQLPPDSSIAPLTLGIVPEAMP